jgi:hypothetical protein
VRAHDPAATIQNERVQRRATAAGDPSRVKGVLSRGLASSAFRSHSRAAAILGDELDAGRLKGALDGGGKGMTNLGAPRKVATWASASAVLCAWRPASASI